MKLRITLFLCAIFLLSVQTIFGETWTWDWNLTPTMTATYTIVTTVDGRIIDDGCLTISTTKAGGEAMPDVPDEGFPWENLLRTITTAVVIGDNITTISNFAFSSTALTSVVFGNSVTTIGEYAFYSCSVLTSITIPNSVTKIKYRAFFNSGLTSIIISNSVTEIEDRVFESCSKLTAINVDTGNPVYSSDSEGILYNKNKTILFVCPISKNGAFRIPNSVVSVREIAFNGCGFNSIIIPNSVVEIGYAAFNGYNSKITTIEVDTENPVFSSDSEGVLYNKNKTLLHSYPGGKNGAFRIPNSVTEIGRNAFEFCKGLTSVTIPNSVISIGFCAFNCCNLTTLTIPKSVTMIGSLAFGSNGYLQDVTVEWLTPLSIPNYSYIFNFSYRATLHVPAGTKALYEVAPVWKEFGTIKEITVIPNETEPVTQDGTGNIELGLSIPSNATLTGSFEIQFPDGMTLDEQLTVLSMELSGNFYLSFTYRGNNTWLIEIKSNGLKSATAVEYRKIMDIAYKVDEQLGKGTYEVTITNLDFTLDDETTINEDLLTVPIHVERSGTSIENVSNKSFYAYITDNMLRIESPDMEIITIYSIAGTQLYSVMKESGHIEIPVSSLRGSMFIIKGNVSGAVKLIKN